MILHRDGKPLRERDRMETKDALLFKRVGYTPSQGGILTALVIDLVRHKDFHEERDVGIVDRCVTTLFLFMFVNCSI